MLVEEDILKATGFTVINNFIVDLEKKCIVTPDHKCTENFRSRIPQEVISNYNLLKTFPSSTVIEAELNFGSKVSFSTNYIEYCKPDTKTIEKHHLSNEFVNKYFIIGKGGKKSLCYSFKIPIVNITIYLVDVVEAKNRLASFSYRKSDSMQNGFESRTALEYTYKITAFAAALSRNYCLEYDSFVYPLEAKAMMYHVYYAYEATKDTRGFDVVETGTKKVEDVMGNMSPSTIDRYLTFINYFYFYLCNLNYFIPKETLPIPIAVLQIISKMQNNVGNIMDDCGGFIVELLKEQILLLRELIVCILNCNSTTAEYLFSFPLKAVCLDKDFHVRNDEYCLKVFNGYKCMLKYFLIYNPNNRSTPIEFTDAFINFHCSPLQNLRAVYNDVYKKRDNYTTTNTKSMEDGSAMVNGYVITFELLRKLYTGLKSEYLAAVKDLREYFNVVSVEECYASLKGLYKFKKDSSFFSCFPENRTTDMVKGININIANNGNINSLLDIYDRITTSIVGLCLLACGFQLRLFEFSKLTHCAPQNIYMRVYKSVEYCFFHTDINKTNALNLRVFFFNNDVTQFLIHYICIIKNIFHSCSNFIPIDPTLFSSEERLKFFDASEELTDLINSTEILKEMDSSTFQRRYLFTSIISRKGKRYLTKIVPKRVGVLFQKIGGDNDCCIRYLRQAFELFNERVSQEVGVSIHNMVTDITNRNSGHSALTALRHYAYDHEGIMADRSVLYEICNEFMLKRDTKLGFISPDPENTEDLSKGFVTSKLVFGYQEIKEAKDCIFPNMKYRENQYPELRAIGSCSHIYALQAPTGFGKTVLFSVILKAVNNMDPGLINLVVVPYSVLETDMTDRLTNLGFNVGKLCEIKTVGCGCTQRDVYIGGYSSLYQSGLNIHRKDLGLLVFDEAHCIVTDAVYRESILDFADFNLGLFQKILLCSATLPEEMVRNILNILKVDNAFLYSNLIDHYPNVGKVWTYSVNSTSVKETPKFILGEILSKYINKFRKGKALVFFQNKQTLESVSREIENSVMVHSDLENKREIVRSFISSNDNRILMGTKLISNGIDIPDVNLVIFFDYSPDSIDFIQGMGRIRGKGLCIHIGLENVCGANVMSKFYGLKKNNHQWCCECPVDKDIVELYQCVIADSNRDSDYDFTNNNFFSNNSCVSENIFSDNIEYSTLRSSCGDNDSVFVTARELEVNDKDISDQLLNSSPFRQIEKENTKINCSNLSDIFKDELIYSNKKKLSHKDDDVIFVAQKEFVSSDEPDDSNDEDYSSDGDNSIDEDYIIPVSRKNKLESNEDLCVTKKRKKVIKSQSKRSTKGKLKKRISKSDYVSINKSQNAESKEKCASSIIDGRVTIISKKTTNVLHNLKNGKNYSSYVLQGSLASLQRHEEDYKVYKSYDPESVEKKFLDKSNFIHNSMLFICTFSEMKEYVSLSNRCVYCWKPNGDCQKRCKRKFYFYHYVFVLLAIGNLERNKLLECLKKRGEIDVSLVSRGLKKFKDYEKFIEDYKQKLNKLEMTKNIKSKSFWNLSKHYFDNENGFCNLQRSLCGQTNFPFSCLKKIPFGSSAFLCFRCGESYIDGRCGSLKNEDHSIKRCEKYNYLKLVILSLYAKGHSISFKFPLQSKDIDVFQLPFSLFFNYFISPMDHGSIYLDTLKLCTSEN